MERCTIGYIYNSMILGLEQRIFIKAAKERNVDLIFFNGAEKFNQADLERKANKCHIIFNDSDDILALELAKTLEKMGSRVIDPTEKFYYTEDKWLFYLNCKKNKIPTPETVLLPTSIGEAKKLLEEFNQWPIILKRVDCSEGRFVEKADNLDDALVVIESFWKKSSDSMPVIAQEFVKSYCFRVLVFDSKIVQTTLKRGRNWKLTGVYAKRFWKFKIDKELKEIINKIAKMTDIKFLGVDLLKKNNKWFVIEANAQPSFLFFDCERDHLIGEVINILKKEAKVISDKAS